jgi:hypothetical protein
MLCEHAGPQDSARHPRRLLAIWREIAKTHASLTSRRERKKIAMMFAPQTLPEA